MDNIHESKKLKRKHLATHNTSQKVGFYIQTIIETRLFHLSDRNFEVVQHK